MNKKGFTLIEILVVVTIIGITSVLIVSKVEKNIKQAKNLKEQELLSTIEEAAYVYANTYTSDLLNINSQNVDSVSINELINKGLLDINYIGDIDVSNTVLIAKIDNEIKTSYSLDNLNRNAIFLIGLDEISINKGITYTDVGAYVAIPGEGVIALTSLNMTSNVNTSIAGSYEIIYSYTDAVSVRRKVTVIEPEANRFKVQFLLNLNGGSTSQTFNNAYNTGLTIILTNPTRRGYEFVNWTVNGATINGNELTIGGNNVTLSANWRYPTTYTIRYNCNGGMGSTLSSTHTFGVTDNFSSNGCYKIISGSSGKIYYLKYWSKTADGTGEKYLANNNFLDITTRYNVEVELYAIYEQLLNITGNYEVIDESNGNWKIKIKGATGQTSGTAQMSVTKQINIDAFLVGGGGSGSSTTKTDDHKGGGGGGGYTKTGTANLSPGTPYSIIIGAGGASVSGATSGKQGGTTSAFALSAAGGNGGITITPSNKSGYSYCNGGNGGSGGAGTNGTKGTDGGNGTGKVTSWSEYTSIGGKGQKTTKGPNNESGSTREFGSATGTLYSEGGASSVSGWTVVNNTGNGGTGSRNSAGLTTGATGIVVIRNKRS